VALTLRHSVLVQIAPNRATLYRKGDDGRIYNTFRMTLANRGAEDAAVRLNIRGLPDARMTLPAGELGLRAGETLKREFEISVPAGSLNAQVNHFEIESVAEPDQTKDVFEQTFIMPLKEEKK